MEGEWSCYRGVHFNRGRMVMCIEVASLKEGEWLCYGRLSLQWDGRMIMLQFNGEHGHVTKVASLMERGWSCLWRWPV